MSTNHDVCLTHGWHLNCARVPVSPPLPTGAKLDAKICRRIWNLPEALRLNRKYQNRQLCMISSPRSTPPAAAPPRLPAVGVLRRRRVPPNEEDEDDEDYHVVKEEGNVAMKDTAPPPGAEELPSEYQALVANGNDEEALLQSALEESEANEDQAYLGYSDAIDLTGMVEEHLASLPPHQSLPPHARWCRITRRRRCRRRPAFNPPP
jgi:hypothetical protein